MGVLNSRDAKSEQNKIPCPPGAVIIVRQTVPYQGLKVLWGIAKAGGGGGGLGKPHRKGNILAKPNRGKGKIMADFHESEPPSCGIFSSIYSFLFLVGI